MTIIPFVTPAGKIFTTFEHRVPLTGTGPFSVGEYFLPNGWTAGIVGTTLVFTGMADEVMASFDASFEIFSCCDCAPITLTTTITVNSGCVYSWSMVPTIAPVGTPVKTTFTAPKSCPADAVLRLAVFQGDGVTPYVLPGVSFEPLVITIPSGTSTYIVQASDANQDLIFKPDVEQSSCLLTCTPSNLRQRRIVPPRADCNIIWSFSTYQFAAGKPTAQTYSVTGLPKGGIAAFDLYVGNVLQDYGDFVLSYESPSVSVGPLTFPTAVIGLDFNYRPRSPLLGKAIGCRILPLRKDFDVVTGTICAINWTLETNAFVAGKGKRQTYSATGIPEGGGVTFDLYIDDVLQTYGDFTLTSAVPSITPGELTFPTGVIGLNFNYRPRVPSLNTAAACRVTPTKIPFVVTGLVCAVNWRLETDVFTAEVGKHQTYSATGIPLGGQVDFGLYVGDVLQTYGAFSLTGDSPSYTPGNLTFGAGGVGLDYNFRPKPPSLGAAATCSVVPAKIPFRILAGANTACAVNWTMLTTNFVAGVATPQKFTAIGLVPGAVLQLNFYDNGVLQTYGGVTLSYANPTYTPNLLTFGTISIGALYTYQAALPMAGAGASCIVTPASTAFAVRASATGACGGIMTATAGACVSTASLPPLLATGGFSGTSATATDELSVTTGAPPVAPLPPSMGPACSSIGVCTVGTAGNVSTQLIANNVPLGATITTDATSDSGVTWYFYSSVVCTSSSSQRLNAIQTTGPCPGFTMSGGVFTATGGTTVRYRVKVAGAVLPNCA